jgi:hypothetical protein
VAESEHRYEPRHALGLWFVCRCPFVIKASPVRRYRLAPTATGHRHLPHTPICSPRLAETVTMGSAAVTEDSSQSDAARKVVTIPTESAKSLLGLNLRLKRRPAIQQSDLHRQSAGCRVRLQCNR